MGAGVQDAKKEAAITGNDNGAVALTADLSRLYRVENYPIDNKWACLFQIQHILLEAWLAVAVPPLPHGIEFEQV